MTGLSRHFYILSSEVVGEPNQLALFERAEREMEEWLAVQRTTIKVGHLNMTYVPVSVSFETIGFFFVHLVGEAEEPDAGGSLQ